MPPNDHEQITRFAHGWEHARARRGNGLPEHETVHLCWGYPFAEPPAWAVAAAGAGKPSASWCPLLSPALLDRDTP